MSRFPELSSTEPSLIGAPCAAARIKGNPAAIAVDPAATSRCLRDNATAKLLSAARDVLLLRAAWTSGRLRARVRQACATDRRREIEADGLADALERWELQGHAEDTVHHLVHRGLAASGVPIGCAGRAGEAR